MSTADWIGVYGAILASVLGYFEVKRYLRETHERREQDRAKTEEEKLRANPFACTFSIVSGGREGNTRLRVRLRNLTERTYRGVWVWVRIELPHPTAAGQTAFETERVFPGILSGDRDPDPFEPEVECQWAIGAPELSVLRDHLEEGHQVSLEIRSGERVIQRVSTAELRQTVLDAGNLRLPKPRSS